METTFKIGEMLKATSNTQGMVAGRLYEVSDIRKDITPWGTFVEYVLIGPGDAMFTVRNGHLLLESA